MREERYGRKTRQRAPKPPFGFWLFIRGFGGETCVPYYEFAVMQLTRFRPVRRRAGGVRFTRLRRKAKHHLFSAISLPKALLPPDSIVLLQLRQKRWHLMNNLPDLKSEVRWFYECSCHFGQCTPRALPTAMLEPRLRGAARRAHGSSAEHAMRDLIASNAPLRNGSHKARPVSCQH